jgi:hypothetical protein
MLQGCIYGSTAVPVLAAYLDADKDVFLLYQPELLPGAYQHYQAAYGAALAESMQKKKKEKNCQLALSTRRSERPQVSTATAETWHRRLGHVYPAAINQLSQLVEGVVIKDTDPRRDQNGSGSELCHTCQLVNAPRQISRRPIGKHYGKCGRVYFDLIQLNMGYNQHCWVTHFYVEGIHLHWAMTHVSKNGCQEAITSFIAFAITWLQLPIRVWHSDNERSVDMRIHRQLEEMGCIHTFTVPYSPEMNGPAERSGGMLIKRARALIKEGKLPEKLWPEAVTTAVYLLNRTPTKVGDNWIIPWDEARAYLQGDKPKTSLANVRLYGALVYCRSQHIPKLEKMRSRAEIGYLVGYVASNIWKVWMPQYGAVRMVRDAVFDESRRYSVDNLDPYVDMPTSTGERDPVLVDQEKETESIHQGLLETMTPNSNAETDFSDDVESGGRAEVNPEGVDEDTTVSVTGQSAATPPPDTQSPGSIAEQTAQTNEPNKYMEAGPRGTPPPTPVSTEPALDQGVDMEGSMTPGGVMEEDLQPASPISEVEEVVEVYMEADTAADTAAGRAADVAALDVANILDGPRSRRQKRDADYAYLTSFEAVEDTSVTLQAFATGLLTPKPSMTQHRDELPPPPECFRKVWDHPLSEGFNHAMRVELEGLRSKGTYQDIEMPRDQGIQVLPLMWVYTYKFDQDGFLIKCKARICVRGDLQTISAEEKRAATLAARTARTLFALVAAYDLDLRQRDAVNAFLNSKLRTPIYTRLPEGFSKPGRCWKLQRALYGLRISPRLWQQDAAAVLRSLGLRQIPEDPCVFVGDGIIVFFYVDDILIACHVSARARAQQLERDLEKHWQLTDQGEAEWFLGIRILRNRGQRKLWLVQDSYLETVAERFHLTNRARVCTPATLVELRPYEGQASPAEIHIYQQKVGSAQYATTITRPDAAKVVSMLSQYLCNPGPEHMQAVDRLICYLYHTRFLALEYAAVESDDEVVRVSSDASYADHSDRKSSAGYICQVFGGPVDWKATKQRTVTTSTTEAELLSLSDAGKTIQWWKRLFDHIEFDYPGKLTILCDNLRTVNLVTAEDTAFDTKLKHVDIHGHWLRQEVSEGRVHVKWVATGQMAADGLTKVLTRQKHENFVKLLRMKDVRSMVLGMSA